MEQQVSLNFLTVTDTASITVVIIMADTIEVMVITAMVMEVTESIRTRNLEASLERLQRVFL